MKNTYYEKNKEKIREKQRAHEQLPEVRARRIQYHKDKRAKIKADPIKHAEQLAKARERRAKNVLAYRERAKKYYRIMVSTEEGRNSHRERTRRGFQSLLLRSPELISRRQRTADRRAETSVDREMHNLDRLFWSARVTLRLSLTRNRAAYRADNPEQGRIWDEGRIQRRKENIRITRRNQKRWYRRSLHDSYIKTKLAQASKGILGMSDFPLAMIEAKRRSIQLGRLISEKEKEDVSRRQSNQSHPRQQAT